MKRSESSGQGELCHGGFPMKVPSSCEPSALPSCEEKGSSEASCEASDENCFHVKVHLKLQMIATACPNR